MQKSILYIILSIASGVAITTVVNSVEPILDNGTIKIATIEQMYQQDASAQGFSDIPALLQFASPELKAAFRLEQAYFDREQMSCNIGHDIM